MISIRDFIKGASSTVVATTFFGSIFGSIVSAFTPKPKPLSRDQIIARALDTREGREALANAMTEPIKNSLNYSDRNKLASYDLD